MSREIPVIVTNAETGEETRYPSLKEAVTILGIAYSGAYKSTLNGYQCHGYFFRREHEGNRAYTDAQWMWLYEQRRKGYTIQELTDFAGCAWSNMIHHWKRLGLHVKKKDMVPLNRAEFEALSKKAGV